MKFFKPYYFTRQPLTPHPDSSIVFLHRVNFTQPKLRLKPLSHSHTFIVDDVTRCSEPLQHFPHNAEGANTGNSDPLAALVSIKDSSFISTFFSDLDIRNVFSTV